MAAERPHAASALDAARPPSPRAQAAIAVSGALLAAGVLVIGFLPPYSGYRAACAVAESLGVAVPIAVGLYALRRDPSNRFARLLIFVGLAWAPAALGLTRADLPYSIGRAWAWGVNLWLVYLLMAFPAGRLTARAERLVFGGALLVLVTLYLPAALMGEFPLPSPWAGCSTGCPQNAFLIADRRPAALDTIEALRNVLTILLFFAAAFLVARRSLRGSDVVRRVHGPVLLFASLNLLALAAFVAARATDFHTGATEVVGVAWLFSMPFLVIGFFAGLLRWRFAAMGAWRRLAPAEDGLDAATRIRTLIANAIRDPSLEIGYWNDKDGGWIDEDGRPFALPPRGTTRARTEVSANGAPVALLVHDDVYLADAAIREVVRGVALMALENQRLEANTRASLRELSESRARIVAAIDKERLRIERDLHDGAQQRLIALKVAAERGAATVDGADQAAALFRRIGADAGAALEEVRSLARGVYPPLLVDFGPVEALHDAARRAAVTTVVRASGVERYPEEVEAAVYFCCLEAMQNAEKHSGAHAVTISLHGNGGIAFEVRDDGRGFDTAELSDGAGLGNMRDRITAVDGVLWVDSVPGAGTRIAGSIPVAPNRVPVEIERLVLRATDALEDALGIYRAVRTASGTIVDFAVEHVNDAACRMAGLSRDAQVGKTLGQLQPAYVRSESFRWHCEALESSEPLLREECEYSRTAGGRRLQVAYEVRGRGLGAGRLALVWRDVTARKRAEQELRFRAQAIAREGDGVCVVRADSGLVAFANARLEEMLGYGPGDLEGRPASELARDGDPLGGDRVPEEMRLRRKDGTQVWSEVITDGFEDPDLGWCWVTVHRDITSRKAEDEIFRLHHERLEGALQSLPALTFSVDRYLRCTLLTDNLIGRDPSRTPRDGSDSELFGSALAPHVGELARRVMVTSVAARMELELDIGHPATVVLAVEPVLDDDGALIGMAGSAFDRSGMEEGVELSALTGGDSPGHRRPRIRRHR